jgi:hypothetical protein
VHAYGVLLATPKRRLPPHADRPDPREVFRP